MNRADVRAGVRRAWTFVERLGIAEALSSFEPLGVNEEFRDVALDPEARYEDLYLTGLQNTHYNFSLDDYAYVQFSWSHPDELRYAYYPNPFLSTTSGVDLRELREDLREGLITQDEYLHRVSELRRGQHAPLIRYENAPRQYVRHEHPASHFHFGHHSDNRWPLDRTLTPSAFTTFIVKQFYGRAWFHSKHVDPLSGQNSLEELLRREKQDCPVVSIDYFGADERLQFFFG